MEVQLPIIHRRVGLPDFLAARGTNPRGTRTILHLGSAPGAEQPATVAARRWAVRGAASWAAPYCISRISVLSGASGADIGPVGERGCARIQTQLESITIVARC